MVEIGILGPLQLRTDGNVIDVGGAKRRSLVARLAVDANRVVALDRLAADLWPDDQAAAAHATIQSYVSRLRKVVGQARLLTRPPGYILVAGTDELDAARFEALLALARRPETPVGEALTALEQAEGLWRGPALAEFADAAWARPVVDRLERNRMEATADRLDALLQLGRTKETVAELEALTRRHPFEERFWRLLVLAHYRTGRQADALRTYAHARATLVEELGVEPSPELRALEQAVLAQDPALDPPQTTAAAGAPPAGPGGTRTVTVLLTDIEASSALWEHDASAMAAATARSEALIAGAVAGAGGQLVKTRGEGDSTFSVFELATDAVRAAADVRRRLEEQRWPAGIELRVRLAVNTGEVLGRDGDFYGPAINRAARLRSLGRGGEILVGAATAALVADALPPGTTLVPVGKRELQGIRRQEEVFMLASDDRRDESAPVPSSDRSWMPPTTTPFVGRDDGVARFQDVLAAAERGAGRLILLGGEPGAGKTRLLAEVGQGAAEAGHLVLYGRCDEDTSLPYQPFVRALTPALGDGSGLDLGALAADLSILFPDVRPLGGMPIPVVDPEARRHRLFEAIDRSLAALARRQPVVLILDDLHWADPAVLLLLRHVASETASRPLVVVGSYRDRDVPPGSPVLAALLDLRRHLPVVDLRLHGMTPADIAAVLEVCARPGTFAEGLAARLHRETAGNPLFVTELVRDLVHDVQQGGAGDQKATGVEQLPVPATVSEVVAVRVAGLQPETQRFLTAASVVGTTFDADVVTEVAGLDEDAAEAAMLEAHDRGVVVDPGTGGHMSFSHAVVRRAVYRRLSAPRQRRLHRAVAEALQRRYVAFSSEDVEELARHFLAGAGEGDVAEAIRYARLAGERAIAQLSYETGIQQFRCALDLLGPAANSTGGPERCELLLALAEALNHGGDAEEAKGLLLECAALAAVDHPALLPQAALAFGGALATGDATDERAIPLLRQALDALEPGDSADRALVNARLMQAAYWVEPRAERALRCDDAVAMGRRIGDRRVLGTVLVNRYWALDGPDDVEPRLRSTAEAERIATELGDLELRLQAGKCRLHLLLSLDAWPEALRLADQLRASATDLREREYLRLALAFDAVVAGNAGRFEQAEQLAAESYDLLRQRGRRAHASFVRTIQRLPWQWLQGRLPTEVEHLRRLVEQDPGRPSWRAFHAWALAEAGEPGAALDALRDVDLHRYLAGERTFDWWMVTLPSALAAAGLGDAPSASLLYEALLPYADRNGVVGQIAFLGAVEHHLGELALALGRDEAAEAHLRRAASRHRAMGAAAYAERTERVLEERTGASP